MSDSIDNSTSSPGSASPRAFARGPLRLHEGDISPNPLRSEVRAIAGGGGEWCEPGEANLGEVYLAADPWIETTHPAVVAKARALGDPCALYHFVRDEIAHSWDIQESAVTATASEVLAAGHGICYAKSHLLAALLRALGIPAGIAYQRLILFDDPADGYSLHALNTAFLDGQWVRLDARGNKLGVDARFPDADGVERLAFPIRLALGEIDYPENFAAPHPTVTAALARRGDLRELYRCGLPDGLAEKTL